MIDTYIEELSRSLRGPRRVKADLLAEARDALVDTAHAYERDGLIPSAAQAQAIAEFGPVDKVGPDYQTELAFSQGRRTALFLFFVMIAQAAAWNTVWPMVRPGPVGNPTPAAAILSETVGWFGAAALVGSLVATVACGIGGRRLGCAGPQVIRATGAFALAVAGTLTVLCVILGFVAPRAGSILDLSIGLPWSLAFLLLPMASVAHSGYRCRLVVSLRDPSP